MNALSALRLLLFACLLTSSCHKIGRDDFFRPGNPLTHCRIKQIHVSEESLLSKGTWQFEYNHNGDPSKISPDTQHSSQPTLYFRYNNQKKMLDFIVQYPYDFYESWHRYAYEGNRIVRDTLRVFGEMINGEPVPHDDYDTFVYHLEYDSHDRIIKTSAIIAIEPKTLTRVDSYYYTTDGNLAEQKTFIPELNKYLTGIVYASHDNKVSIRRTDKTWMFIDRDYSINNLQKANSYNSFGLPLEFSVDSLTRGYPFITQIFLGLADIKYECK